MIKKIAHITDLHLDEDFPFKNQTVARKRFDAILEDIAKNHISHIICTGDIGENEGIPYFFDTLKALKLSITLGNHDSFSEIAKHYTTGANYTSKKVYSSIVMSGYKCIFLDSSEGYIDDAQLTWLKAELLTNKPIIIFLHHPLLALPLKVDEIGKLKNRQQVVAMLTNTANNISIYCGHYHMESTLTYKNITQFITPSVSYQIKKHIDSIEIDTTTSGYRIIEFHNDKLFSKVKRLQHAD